VKIIDAFWEERNLGLKVCEIIFEENEIIDFDAIADLGKSYQYIVAKIPGDSVHLVHNLESHGFIYLENQQVIYILSDEFLNIDKNWEQRFNNISCEKVSDRKDLDNICDQIKKGLYIKGRISSDPEIKNGISDLRIVNWLNDLAMREDVFIYRLIKDENAIGYFALQKINIAHFNVVQAAIFSNFQNKGYSFLLPYYSLKIAQENKFKGIFATVSSNNLKTINSISKFVHFKIRKTYIVMRKKVPGEYSTSKMVNNIQ
jgi:hypothetical protein